MIHCNCPQGKESCRWSLSSLNRCPTPTWSSILALRQRWYSLSIQLNDEDVLHSIVFCSKIIILVENNYHIYDKKLLIIIQMFWFFWTLKIQVPYYPIGWADTTVMDDWITLYAKLSLHQVLCSTDSAVFLAIFMIVIISEQLIFFRGARLRPSLSQPSPRSKEFMIHVLLLLWWYDGRRSYNPVTATSTWSGLESLTMPLYGYLDLSRGFDVYFPRIDLIWATRSVAYDNTVMLNPARNILRTNLWLLCVAFPIKLTLEIHRNEAASPIWTVIFNAYQSSLRACGADGRTNCLPRPAHAARISAPSGVSWSYQCHLVTSSSGLCIRRAALRNYPDRMRHSLR